MTNFSILTALIAVVAVIILYRTARVVPQQQVFVVERLGRYRDSLKAGFHLLVPFLDRIAYRHSLKERAIDVPQQVCITRDNVQISVDGVLYLQVVDAKRASYGIGDYVFAIAQLAQTTLRSEVGKIDLDRTFEERATINASVVQEVDRASDPWGVKVLRYEIRDIAPPSDVLSAMEKQMRAEREKRATILASEADRESQINRAEGEKQRVIRESEAQRQRQINEAEGEAQAIRAVATATAEGIRKVGEAISAPGGLESARIRVAEQYVSEFGQLARTTNTLILPANLADISGFVATAMEVIKGGTAKAPPAK